MLRKLVRYAKKILGFSLGLLMSYGLLVLVLGNVAYHEFRAAERPFVTIYLVSNGVHTDIVMPMKHDVFDWHTQLNPHDTAGGSQTVAQYVAIGWGSRSFYLDTPTWADLTPTVAFKALFGLDKSALHVTFYPDAPERSERVVSYRVTRDEYRQLVQAILPSFARDEHQRPQLIPHAHYASNDAFYEAQGTYHAYYTCNTWTNERLKISGLPSVYWTPFAHQLIDFYQENHANHFLKQPE